MLGGCGHRAAAFLAEARDPCRHADAVAALQKGLKLLAAVVRPSRSKPPLVFTIVNGDARAISDYAGALAEIIEQELHSLTLLKRKKAMEEARRWARTAGQEAGHKATKAPAGIAPMSASAGKAHMGEPSQQRAADAGVEEWCLPWKAGDSDGASEVLQALEALDCTNQQETDIELPPFTARRITQVCLRFRGGTGLGKDWLRPRHVALLSLEARRALCRLLQRIEAVRRWPFWSSQWGAGLWEPSKALCGYTLKAP